MRVLYMSKAPLLNAVECFVGLLGAHTLNFDVPAHDHVHLCRRVLAIGVYRLDLSLIKIVKVQLWCVNSEDLAIGLL